MNRRSLLSALALSSVLAGCNLAPQYVRPVPPVPSELPQGGIYPAAASDATDITRIGWHDFFTDPRLMAIIDKGLENNRDLRAAAARVLQARAQFSVRRADRVPSLDVSGSATYSNSSSGRGAGGAGNVGGTGSATGVSNGQSIFSLSAGFSSFELDLFGRVANLSRAAQEQVFASQEAQRATRISLIAEIATAWLQLAADQDQLRISQDTLETYDKTMQLSQARFRIGVSSELEARQAETGFQGARADIAALQTRLAQDRNALDLLVGAPIPAELLPSALGDAHYTREVLTREVLAPNLSSAILLQRPDVLQAEHQLIAENADIGAARAAFFPRISLTGLLGTLSTALSGLFAGGSFTYSAGPSLSLPVFDGGRNKGNLEYARASQQLAVANYEKAIQTAFREVADALAQRGTIDEQLGAQAARANAARIASRLSDARYRAGVDSYLVALDAQRSAYASEQQLVTTRQARALSMIDLYRRLGGGFDPAP